MKIYTFLLILSVLSSLEASVTRNIHPFYKKKNENFTPYEIRWGIDILEWPTVQDKIAVKATCLPWKEKCIDDTCLEDWLNNLECDCYNDSQEDSDNNESNNSSENEDSTVIVKPITFPEDNEYSTVIIKPITSLEDNGDSTEIIKPVTETKYKKEYPGRFWKSSECKVAKHFYKVASLDACLEDCWSTSECNAAIHSGHLKYCLLSKCPKPVAVPTENKPGWNAYSFEKEDEESIENIKPVTDPGDYTSYPGRFWKSTCNIIDEFYKVASLDICLEDCRGKSDCNGAIHNDNKKYCLLFKCPKPTPVPTDNKPGWTAYSFKKEDKDSTETIKPAKDPKAFCRIKKEDVNSYCKKNINQSVGPPILNELQMACQGIGIVDHHCNELVPSEVNKACSAISEFSVKPPQEVMKYVNKICGGFLQFMLENCERKKNDAEFACKKAIDQSYVGPPALSEAQYACQAIEVIHHCTEKVPQEVNKACYYINMVSIQPNQDAVDLAKKMCTGFLKHIIGNCERKKDDVKFFCKKIVDQAATNIGPPVLSQLQSACHGIEIVNHQCSNTIPTGINEACNTINQVSINSIPLRAVGDYTKEICGSFFETFGDFIGDIGDAIENFLPWNIPDHLTIQIPEVPSIIPSNPIPSISVSITSIPISMPSISMPSISIPKPSISIPKPSISFSKPSISFHIPKPSVINIPKPSISFSMPSLSSISFGFGR